ncbi:bifunctional indole-3-glycerol-phosphate synthase TrpC/phosphoribosylanthranilate isomerase TrpF [Buchnera aphidicola]|uniref:bifunctional indole-3-glycerol-phosphate synthase TrpC/phosphoribosylanthranilate isomerase TrpF n=1 Tax=Buchnera aphidicola TaxID=9 RepID=UPI00107C2A81|nr:bifunctional indole-3-glycerol-phosphate synthase TrpC/phosphoribosylanthranilate isomerase TrpF [Buchnera aphidicola]VFP79191.1 Tryptophan biosynthesis protein TrpCF [Buchnera aphidicola (Cinara curtihirsuta)]
MNNNFISKILKNTHDWVKYKKNNFPLSSFYNKIEKSRNCFEKILKKNNPSFILECKKASPLNGIIKKNFNISKIVKIYNKYADIISIITEEKFFHGNFKYLLQARNETKKPLLCKDFFIDPYQIYYARYHKADAILLMLSILDDSSYIKLSNIAKNMNLGVLTEIHTFNELKRALLLNASVIGINNRNLKTLSIDKNNTRTLAPLIPKNKIIICESGINNYKDIRSLCNKVNGFLIGTHLMCSKNLEFSTRKLIYGDNKICGLTKNRDALLAEQSGCVYGGLIFIPHSPRYIHDKKCKKIIKNSLLKYVGVFYNEQYKNILIKVDKFNLYAIQLHGEENQEFIQKLKILLPKHVRIWKSISVSKHTVINNIIHVNRYLLDNRKGGSGKTFDWTLIKKFNVSNMMLAGGLNLKNSFLASTLGFCGLDFNSGLEILPGVKDPNKIKSVFKILRYYPKK